MTRHLSCLSDLGPEGLPTLLDLADGLRDTRGRPNAPRPLAGKSVALVFEKASTRTRISLEVAVSELGGHPLVITAQGSQMARGEPLSDTARVLSRMVHAITFRTSTDERLAEMMRYSRVPVLNALTDGAHPMQLLADLQTVRGVKGKLQGLNYAWVGDGNNMACSWIEAAGLLGLNLRLACPEGFDPPADTMEKAKQAGAQLTIERSVNVAVRDADVVSTDVFASMGQEAEQAARLRAFAGFRLTPAVMSAAKGDAMVLHCLPAHRGEEIDEQVLEGPNSHVWDQAEARLHTSKAILLWALEADG